MTTTTLTTGPATRPDGINCWGCSNRARNVLPHPSRALPREEYAAAISEWLDSHFCTKACADRFDTHIRDTAQARCIAAGVPIAADLYGDGRVTA